MANVTDYYFDQSTRIGNDTCDISQRNMQNINKANHVLENYYPACPMNKAVDFATSQPSVFYKGSQQVGINGCNIDDNSELLMPGLSRPKTKMNLFTRPYLTVPFLGRGTVDTDMESKIIQGDSRLNRKTTNSSGETSLISHQTYPLIPQIKSTVTNPVNLVESVASDGWIRGGLPSRSLQRDVEYDVSTTS